MPGLGNFLGNRGGGEMLRKGLDDACFCYVGRHDERIFFIVDTVLGSASEISYLKGRLRGF